jgi:hypothetical protein
MLITPIVAMIFTVTTITTRFVVEASTALTRGKVGGGLKFRARGSTSGDMKLLKLLISVELGIQSRDNDGRRSHAKGCNKGVIART